MTSMQKIGLCIGVIIVSMLVMVRPSAADTYNADYAAGGCPGGADGWHHTTTTQADMVSAFIARAGSVSQCTPSITVYEQCPTDARAVRWCYASNPSSCGGCFLPYTSVTPSACPAANTVQSSGLYDIGDNPNRVRDGILNGCGANNCATAVGSLDPISKRGIIGGQMHYFAVGVIVFTGQTCAAGAPSVATSTDPNIQQTCAPGQVAVTGANGFFQCYADGFNTASSSVPTTTTQTTSSTSTTTDQQTGASSVTTTQTVSETTTSAGTSGGSSAAADQLQTYCQQNPSADVCKQNQPSGTVSTAALTGLYNGDLNAAGHQTVSDVVGSFKGRVMASPVGGAAAGFFSVSVAPSACPVWSADVPMIGTITFDVFCQPTFQDMLPWIKSVILIIFSIVAFRIAIL